jgi:hypothetical protein
MLFLFWCFDFCFSFDWRSLRREQFIFSFENHSNFSLLLFILICYFDRSKQNIKKETTFKKWQDFISKRRLVSSLEEICRSAASKRARHSVLWLLYIYCHLFCCSKLRSSHIIFRLTDHFCRLTLRSSSCLRQFVRIEECSKISLKNT